MDVQDDIALLRQYTKDGSEAAFETLVSRYIGLVHSAALRQANDPNLAQEITQAVFIIFAQKAGRISEKAILTGWLFNTTRFVALAQRRAAVNRSIRLAAIEKEFQMQTEFPSVADDETWQRISPLLDDALASLRESDRQAVLLRFFENKCFAEVGNALRTSEDTARKRVARALEKLRMYFSRHGVSSTTAFIAGTVSAHSVHIVPDGLVKAISAIAASKGTAATATTLTLTKGALKIMTWTKAKATIGICVGLILIGGALAFAVKDRSHSAQGGDAVSSRSAAGPTLRQAMDFLTRLKREGRLPGDSKTNPIATIKTPTSPEMVAHNRAELRNLMEKIRRYPFSETFTAVTRSSPAWTSRAAKWEFNYAVAKSSRTDEWHLQRAWRVDATGRTVEEYPVR